MNWDIYKPLIATGISFFTGALMILILVFRKKEAGLAGRLWLKYFVYLGIVVLVFVSILLRLHYYLFALIAAGGLVEMIRLAVKPESALRGFRLVFSFVIYVLSCCGLALVMLMRTQDLCGLYAAVVIFDGFSQLSGELFGKHKFVQRISPGKTIEGLAGGMLGLSALVFWIIPSPLSGAILVIFLVTISALGGDLLASYYKRTAGVKDFSGLIPGHGGLLDRFDSFFGAGLGILLLGLIILVSGG